MKRTFLFCLGLALGVLLASPGLGLEVVNKEGKTFIVDRTGEAWDISQAAARGFNPQGFEHGLGREAIKPLGQDSVRSPGGSVPGRIRVIGFSSGDDAVAVSVRRLAKHEVANLTLSGRPVAITY